jgi:hypothetical protein
LSVEITDEEVGLDLIRADVTFSEDPDHDKDYRIEMLRFLWTFFNYT